MAHICSSLMAHIWPWMTALTSGECGSRNSATGAPNVAQMWPTYAVFSWPTFGLEWRRWLRMSVATETQPQVPQMWAICLVSCWSGVGKIVARGIYHSFTLNGPDVRHLMGQTYQIRAIPYVYLTSPYIWHVVGQIVARGIYHSSTRFALPTHLAQQGSNGFFPGLCPIPSPTLVQFGSVILLTNLQTSKRLLLR